MRLRSHHTRPFRWMGGLLILAWGSVVMAAEPQMFLFPSYGFTSLDGKHWIVNVRVWAFEPEEQSLLRELLLDSLRELAPVTEDEENNPLFKERAHLFLVDNERNRRPRLEVGGRTITMNPTSADGHTFQQILVPLSAGRPGEEIPLRVRVSSRGRFHTGKIHLQGTEGPLVVSDIDDTIKVSSVTDRAELLANTFFRPWRAVSGMADLYRWWGEQGADVHYLSASPWQLQPALHAFLSEHGFPEGVYHMRRFRLKEGASSEFWGDPSAHKRRILDRLSKEFPAREFVLVGDDGEQDPETYGEFARRHPGVVKAIFIRRVKGPGESARFEKAFAGLPVDRWRVFENPRELMP